MASTSGGPKQNSYVPVAIPPSIRQEIEGPSLAIHCPIEMRVQCHCSLQNVLLLYELVPTIRDCCAGVEHILG